VLSFLFIFRLDYDKPLFRYLILIGRYYRRSERNDIQRDKLW